MRVLQFSGGKDSIACLLLFREQLEDITVMWVNSGAAFPETIEQMEKVRSMCPRFIEVKADQPKQIEENGFPVDLLPVRNHRLVQAATSEYLPRLQGFLECCYSNLMAPMHEAAKKIGATTIIRGQKSGDRFHSPVKSGEVIDGVTYIFPLEDWSDEDVREYVRDSDLLPKHYAEANTSLDCWSCTAYQHENKWKLPYLEKNHPHLATEVKRRMVIIREQIQRVTNA